MTNPNKMTALIATVAALLILGGCATSYVERRVLLGYDGPRPSNLLGSSVKAFKGIIVVPVVDLRKKKNTFGTYTWGNMSVNYISGGETVSAGITRMVVEFLSRAGMQPIAGKWNGRIDTLPKLKGDHAIYCEIERLDFSGKGRFYDTKNIGMIRIVMKWGSRALRKVITKTVEVTPDNREFHLFSASFDHVSKMDELIRKTVSKAIRESITTIFKSPK